MSTTGPDPNESESVDVLQVITSTARRGAERFAVTLGPLLERRGLSTRTVALVAGSGATVDAEVLGSRRLGPSTLVNLRRATKQCQVVVAHGSTTLPATAAATLGLRVPFVYRNIGDPLYWSPTGLRRLRTSMLLSRAEVVVALTEESGRRLQSNLKIPADRIVPIPRGVSPTEFPRRSDADRDRARAELGLDRNQMIAVTIGALGPEKAVPDAVRALGHLPERWHLIIAGDGPDRPAVEAAAAEVGPQRVTMLGSTDSVLTVLNAADVLILPSTTEGLPGVVIEAAMVGVPAVATDVGFVRDIIDPGRTGSIVTAGQPAALAAAVLDTEPDLSRFGTAANEHVMERFALSTTADRWHEVLSTLIASRPLGAPVRS